MNSSDDLMDAIEYLFIDESGDLGQYGSKYFTIAAVRIKDRKQFNRIIKKVRENILKKKDKETNEIKANNSNRRIREYVLKEIGLSDCVVFATIIEKAKIFSHLYDVKNKLYNYFCGVLLDNVQVEASRLIIVIDRRSKNKLIREDLSKYVRRRLGTTKSKLTVEIYQDESYTAVGLQMADFIAWAINRKFNTGDDYYYKLIESKIANKEKMELWK